ncbi:MAG TPA: glycosyl transferase [Verrucomicrobiales bacterium]|nr:glycosyl transferase [Verrucomicrobiales bacterium]
MHNHDVTPGASARSGAVLRPLPPAAAPFLARTLILIPALNESQAIRATVQEWIALGVGAVRVVDNGSTDDTARVAADAGAEVVREPRRGYGAACWTGLLSPPAGIEWVLFSSADGSDRFQPAELPLWQQAVDEGVELVLGNRCLFPGAVATLRPVQRFGSWLCGALMRLAWGVDFQDMGSRRLLRVATFRRLGLRDRAFGWNVEMQVRAVEQRVRFVELPVPYFPRRAGKSKISGTWVGGAKAAWGILSTLLTLWITRPFRR